MTDLESYYDMLADISVSRAAEDLAITERCYGDLARARGILTRDLAKAYEDHKRQYLSAYKHYNQPDEKGKMPSHASVDTLACTCSGDEKIRLKQLEEIKAAIQECMYAMQSIISLHQSEIKLEKG